MAKQSGTAFRPFQRSIMLCLIVIVLRSLSKDLKNTHCHKASDKGPSQLQNNLTALRGEDPSNMAKNHSQLVLDIEDSLPVDWGKLSKSKNCWLDIGVPVAGSDGKLLQFATTLGASMSELRRHVDRNCTVRLLITRYPTIDDQNNTDKETFRQLLLRTSSVDVALFVMVNHTQFQRVIAANALHENACHKDDCVLTIMDVDMDIGPGFFVNALTSVSPNTIYFPIVFSQYRPSSVFFLESLFGPLPKFDKDKGVWVTYGYGIYALSGADVLKLMMNESFKGWGLEDNDFFSRAKKSKFRIVRRNEHHLVHRWHLKICQLGVTVHGELPHKYW